jgi:hypothetical protein
MVIKLCLTSVWSQFTIHKALHTDDNHLDIGNKEIKMVTNLSIYGYTIRIIKSTMLMFN